MNDLDHIDPDFGCLCDGAKVCCIRCDDPISVAMTAIHLIGGFFWVFFGGEIDMWVLDKSSVAGSQHATSPMCGRRTEHRDEPQCLGLNLRGCARR